MVISTLILFSLLLSGIYLQLPMSLTLALGLIPFLYLSWHRGFKPGTLFQYLKQGFVNLSNTYRLLFLISATTALWLDSGTLQWAVSSFTKGLGPHNFLLMTFLICWAGTLLLGSALGTAGTVGILFMGIAESSGYPLSLTAGAVVSAIYMGERTSPVSSCANLVADLNGISVFQYIAHNFRRILPSLALTIFLYGGLSWLFPLHMDSDVLFSNSGNSGYINAFISAAPILILILGIILFKNVILALLSSMTAAFLIGLLVYDQSLLNLVNHLIFGTLSNNGAVPIQAKGLIGVLPTVLIVMASALYSGLFTGTRLFEPLKNKLLGLAETHSLYHACIISSLLGAAIGCSQTFATLFSHQLLSRSYGDEESDRIHFSGALADTSVLLPALIPWNMAASVPAAILGVGYGYMPFAFILYLPILIALSPARKIIIRLAAHFVPQYKKSPAGYSPAGLGKSFKNACHFRSKPTDPTS